MVAAPVVCEWADAPPNAKRNAVVAIAARIRWGQKFMTFIMGSPQGVKCQ
jgi:hypothetical protein